MTDPRHDRREALQLLSNAHVKESWDAPEMRTKREAAALALLKDVLEIAVQAHFVLSKGKIVVGSGQATIWIGLVGDPSGIHVVWEPNAGQSKTLDPALEFDDVTGSWVGKELDTFVVPIPGQPFARRSAAAVVAASIVTALERLS